MKRIMLLLVFAVCAAVPEPRAIAQPADRPARRVESAGGNDRDMLGYFRSSSKYTTVIASNAFVVNLPEEQSFFVVWAPPSGEFDRVMFLLHGTGGTAYEEVGDELPSAREHGYALVGIQWLDKSTGEYALPLVINRRIDKAMRFLQKRYGVTPRVGALCGFSRGSAVSYEVAYLDRRNAGHLDFIISHSGGIPTDNVVAPGESNTPGKFYADLTSGKLGSDAMSGCVFFLYAGCKDEEWGTKMCAYMEYTRDVLQRTGAKVAECIIDPNGKHMGYRTNREYHDRAIRYFLAF